MSYLVDGNNLMAQRVGWHKDRTLARRRLLDETAQFAITNGLSIRVVFDGAPDDHFPDGSRYRGVEVLYALRGSDADERIKQIVESTRNRQSLIVVTSDKALSDYVRRCGVRVVRSGEFRKRLDAVKNGAKTRAEATNNNENGTLNEWMRYFGVAEDE
jgi:predicted RNA-binding protein with PIN domain